MINIKILPIACHRYYLSSPKTWLHTKFKQNKIAVFFLYIFLLPYIKLKLLVIYCLLLILLICSLKLPEKIMYSVYQPVLIYIICAIVLSISYGNTNYYTSLDYITVSIQNIYHVFKLNSFVPQNYLLKQIIFPVFAVRSIIIFSIYLLSMNFFCLTTKHEDIVRFILALFGKQSFIAMKKTFFLSLLSLYFIDIIYNKISYIIMGLKIRGKDIRSYNTIITYIKMYYFISNYTLAYFYSKVFNLSSALYVKNAKII